MNCSDIKSQTKILADLRASLLHFQQHGLWADKSDVRAIERILQRRIAAIEHDLGYSRQLAKCDQSAA
jgi:hypothetical protein